MRKFILAAGMIGALSASIAHADDDVGCGLGTMVWAGQEGLIPKVLAATTNGTFGNQTFGITSGTLGCSRDGVITSDAVAAAYTGSNIERLALDMSQGEGESLNVMAELLGIEEQDKPAFFALAKDNFANIFASENVTAGDVLASLNEAMAADADLAHYAS